MRSRQWSCWRFGVSCASRETSIGAYPTQAGDCWARALGSHPVSRHTVQRSSSSRCGSAPSVVGRETLCNVMANPSAESNLPLSFLSSSRHCRSRRSRKLKLPRLLNTARTSGSEQCVPTKLTRACLLQQRHTLSCIGAAAHGMPGTARCAAGYAQNDLGSLAVAVVQQLPVFCEHLAVRCSAKVVRSRAAWDPVVRRHMGSYGHMITLAPTSIRTRPIANKQGEGGSGPPIHVLDLQLYR